MDDIIGEEFTALECMMDITVTGKLDRTIVINYFTASQNE